jgi:sigma-B regulation protein RsbU (phosphoserine phosphatase)
MPEQVTVQVLSARQESLGNTLATLRDFVSRAGRSAELTPRSIYNLKLAVDEIATNIVMYAYRTVDDDELLTVTARVQEGSLTIIIEDTGTPYDPREYTLTRELDKPLDTRELGGLGIYFAINNVDEFEYEYEEGCNRNLFTMYRPLSAIKTETDCNILLYTSQHNRHKSIQSHLKESGYSVTSTAERKHIIHLIQQDRFDLLILDGHLPPDDSFRLLKRLRVMLEQANMPILVIGSDGVYIARCMELGATDFLLSPIDPVLLELRIKLAIDHSKAALRRRIQKLSQHIKEILLSDKPDLRFGREMDIDHFLEHVLIEVQGIYNADAGTVYLLTEDDTLRFAIVRTNSLNIALGGTSGKQIELPLIPLFEPITELPNHYNVASHVALTGKTINIPDIYENKSFDFAGTRWFDERNQYRSVSTLTVPLKDHNDEVVGVVQLINAQDEAGHIVPFDFAQQMLVEALCAHTAVVLSTYRLIQRQAQLVKIENDIKIGRQIQRDFMPSHIPYIEGWQVATRFYPAREVAGDFFDMFPMDGYLVAILSDVCDKGVGAALFMALTRSLLRAFISQAREHLLALPRYERTPSALAVELRKVVQHTNDYILTHHYDLNMFATLFLGVVHLRTGRMFYINAGHTPAPILYHTQTGEIERMRPTGPAVGMFDEAWFEVLETRLKRSDIVFAFTDGVTDMQNRHGELLGEDEILKAIKEDWQTMEHLLTHITDLVFNQMGTTTQFDDMTFWAFRREE